MPRNIPLNAMQLRGLSALGAVNPGFGPEQPPAEGGYGALCSSDRVVLAGGQLASYMKPEGMLPLEYVFRRLPIDGIFDATPNRPCQFEMGNFAVPAEHGFVLLDYNFNIYRPSGAAADDFVPLEDNRLSTQVGWDIQANATRQGNYRYEIQPIPPENNAPAYQSAPNPGLIPGGVGQGASDDQFAAARFTQVQSAVGDALSLMPQRHHREGILQVPAPWVLHSNQSLTVSVRVFRAIQIPIAFFEAEIFGFLMPDANLIQMEKHLAPCISKPGGV